MKGLTGKSPWLTVIKSSVTRLTRNAPALKVIYDTKVHLYSLRRKRHSLGASTKDPSIIKLLSYWWLRGSQKLCRTKCETVFSSSSLILQACQINNDTYNYTNFNETCNQYLKLLISELLFLIDSIYTKTNYILFKKKERKSVVPYNLTTNYVTMHT